jgi:hypothetical protein
VVAADHLATLEMTGKARIRQLAGKAALAVRMVVAALVVLITTTGLRKLKG